MSNGSNALLPATSSKYLWAENVLVGSPSVLRSYFHHFLKSFEEAQGLLFKLLLYLNKVCFGDTPVSDKPVALAVARMQLRENRTNLRKKTSRTASATVPDSPALLVGNEEMFGVSL